MKRSASIVLACAALGASLLPAQRIPSWPPPRPSFSSLLTERVRLYVAPSFALQTSSAPRSGVDALLAFGADTGSAVVPELTLDLTGARTRRAGYSRSGVGGRLRWRALPLSPWAGGTIGVGSGAGPARVLRLHGGLAGNAVNLDVRTTWLTAAGGKDTVTSMVRRDFVLVDSSYTDVEVSGNRRVGRFDFDLLGGARFGASLGQRQWLYGVVRTPLFSRIGIALSGGWRPAQPELAQRGGRFAMVSLLYRTTQQQGENRAAPPQPARLQAVSIGKDRYLLTLSQGNARSVRIKGDLTNWDAVELQRGEADVWQIDLSASAGVYKINLSIDDGPWLVPGGLVAVPDGFGGSAGVLNLN